MSVELKQFHNQIAFVSTRQHLPGPVNLEVPVPYSVVVNERGGRVTLTVEGRATPLAEFMIWSDTPSGVAEAVGRAHRLIEEHSASR